MGITSCSQSGTSAGSGIAGAGSCGATSSADNGSSAAVASPGITCCSQSAILTGSGAAWAGSCGATSRAGDGSSATVPSAGITSCSQSGTSAGSGTTRGEILSALGTTSSIGAGSGDIASCSQSGNSAGSGSAEGISCKGASGPRDNSLGTPTLASGAVPASTSTRPRPLSQSGISNESTDSSWDADASASSDSAIVEARSCSSQSASASSCVEGCSPTSSDRCVASGGMVGEESPLDEAGSGPAPSKAASLIGIRRAPHRSQSVLPAGFTSPHIGHRAPAPVDSGAPHSLQERLLSRLDAPHFIHPVIALPLRARCEAGQSPEPHAGQSSPYPARPPTAALASLLFLGR